MRLNRLADRQFLYYGQAIRSSHRFHSFVFGVHVKSLQLAFELVRGFLKDRVEHDLKISTITQPSSQTCWATCYQMVDAWNQNPQQICYYVRLQTTNCGGCAKPQNHCNRNRKTAQVLSDWRKIGYGGTRHYPKPLTLTEIRNAHKKRRPIHIFYVLSGRRIDDGHFAIITGTTRCWNADTALLISDPASSKRTVNEFEYSNFRDSVSWSESWVVDK